MTVQMSPQEAHEAILKGECPDNAIVSGDLRFEREQALTRLPDGLKVKGRLHIFSCHKLKELPRGLSARTIEVDHCASLWGTAPSFQSPLEVSRDLIFRDCPQLAVIPTEINVGRDLVLSNCARLGGNSPMDPVPRVPHRVTVGRDAILEACPALSHSPERLKVGNNLWVHGCQLLPILSCEVGADLFIHACASLKRLVSITFSKPSHMSLKACDTLESIGDGVRPRGYLSITDCPALTKLPSGMRLEAGLSVSECEALEEQPEGLVVLGETHLQGPAGGWNVQGANSREERTAIRKQKSPSLSLN